MFTQHNESHPGQSFHAWYWRKVSEAERPFLLPVLQWHSHHGDHVPQHLWHNTGGLEKKLYIKIEMIKMLVWGLLFLYFKHSFLKIGSRWQNCLQEWDQLLCTARWDHNQEEGGEDRFLLPVSQKSQHLQLLQYPQHRLHFHRVRLWQFQLQFWDVQRQQISR